MFNFVIGNKISSTNSVNDIKKVEPKPVEVKKVVDGKVVYDFDNVPYHKV